MKLLFVMAEWHGLAKLRMHTEATLELLDKSTTELGARLRDFKKTTCAAYATKELAREANIRKRRAEREAKKKGKLVASTPAQGFGSKSDGRQPKELNLNTIKVHFLGDYTTTIREYGTADSYSTQAV